MDELESNPAVAGARLLSLDGSEAGTTELSELALLKELMQRIEELEDLDETPAPHKYFDLIGGTGVGGIFAILFAAWRLTVEEAIDAYYVLYEKVLTSDAWKSHDTDATQSLLQQAICDIAGKFERDPELLLGTKKVSQVDDKGFTCTLNPENLTGPRLLCTYRPRANRSPTCTVTQAIMASLAGRPHLDPIVLGKPPQKFIAGNQRVANPTSQLLNEAQLVFGADHPVSCVVSIGAGLKDPIAVATEETSEEATLAKLVSDAEQRDQEIERRCGGIKDLYFRLNVIHGLGEADGSSDALSVVATHTSQYLGLTAIGKKLDRLVEVLCERPTPVTAGRLNSVLGPDAQDQTLQVVKEIDAGVKQIYAIEQDDRFHDIVTWLLPNQSFYGSLRECRQSREEGTGLWLFECDEFRNWLEGYVHMLTLQGIPGGGKTILASIVYDHLATTKSDDSHVVLGAFITHGITTSIDDIFACLLSQVLDDGTGRLAAEVEALYKKRSFGRPLIDELSYALRARLSRAPRVMVILDALDEFPSEHRERLLLSLLDFSPSVNVFVTSRPLPQMQFEGLSVRCIQIEESHQADLRLFVQQRMQHDSRLQRILSNRIDLSKKVMDSVLARCNGMFLLARFHMDEIATYRTAVALENALAMLPTTAPQKYATTLDRIGKQSGRDGIYATHTLMWMSLAQSQSFQWGRFDIDQLILAVASSADELGDSPEKVNLSEQDIVEVCSGLVVVRYGCPEFVHLTAQEFFNEHFGYSTNSARFCGAQHELANGCLRYMLLSKTQETLHHVIDPNRRWQYHITNGFTEYCALEFGNHVRLSESAEEMVSKFFSDPPLYKLAACLLVEKIENISDSQELHSIELFSHLHWASCFGIPSVCSTLIRFNDVNSQDMFGRSPIFYAVQEGHSSVVRLMLSQTNVEADSRDNYGCSPLSYAAQWGTLEVVQLLLNRSDVDVNSRDNSGQTPLSYAAQWGTLEVVQLLLSRKDVELNSRDNGERSPLLHAAKRGKLDVVQLLLGREDVDVNSQDKFGNTPLSYAAEKRNLDVVQPLLSRGDVDVNSRDNSGQTPLSYAAQWGTLEVVQLLLSRKDVELNSRDNGERSPLLHAAKRGKLDIVQLLLGREDVDVNSRDNSGQTPLSYAAQWGTLEVVQLLLSRKDVELNSRDKFGNTPLSYAAEKGNLDVVQLLLSQPDIGADSRDSKGRSPLSHAAEERKLDAVQMLLNRPDVDVNSRDNSGQTPLLYAARKGYLDIVQLLLGRGDVEADSRDKYGRSPLFHAAGAWRGTDVVQLLFSRTDVEADPRDKDGRSPLLYAAKQGNLDIVQLLLSRTDVEADSRDKDGRSPLSYAAQQGNLDIVQLLLSRTDVEADSRDKDGRSPFSYAAATPWDKDVVKYILGARGVAVNSRDHLERSVTFHAARSGIAAIRRHHWRLNFEILDFKENLEMLIGCERFVLDVKTLVEVARFYKTFWRYQRNGDEYPDGSGDEDESEDEEEADSFQSDSEVDWGRGSEGGTDREVE